MTPAGLVRASAASGTENGIERPVIRTKSGRYLSRDFIFEVEVTIPADHGDIAYMGFGEGVGNLTMDNEPSNAYLFRVHNLPSLSFFGVDVAVGKPDGGQGFRGQYLSFHRLGTYPSGQPMRLRIEHRQGQVTLSAPGHPDIHKTFATAEYPGLFDAEHAFLFLANSSQGTTFRNATLRAP